MDHRVLAIVQIPPQDFSPGSSERAPSTDHFDFDAAAEQGWEDALALIREQGDDPAEVIKRAGENLDAWRQNPWRGDLSDEDFEDEG
jgi:hypothetical protein